MIVYDGDGNRVSDTVGGATTNYLVDTVNPTGYAQVVDELQSPAMPAWNSQLESGVERNNFRFAVSGWVFHAKIEAAPAQRIADAPLLVGRQHNKRNALGADRAELRNAERPNA